MGYDDTANFGLQGSKSQQDKRKPLDGKNGGTEKGATRITLGITSYRCRLLDEDNLTGGCKQIIDALKYSGLLHDDSPKEISFKASQVRVAHRKDEKTVVDIEYP